MALPRIGTSLISAASLSAVAGAAWALVRRRAGAAEATVGFFAVALAGYAFMTLAASTPIGLALKPLELVQFPWRMLGPAALCAALLVGASVPVLEGIARSAVLGGTIDSAAIASSS